MNNKRTVILISAIFLLLIVGLPLVMASTMDPFSSLFDVFKSAVSLILKLFDLKSLGLDVSGNQETFMRFIIWIISFALFNALLNLLPFVKSGYGAKGMDKLPMVISICLATMTAVFTPGTVLLAIGMQYSAVLQVILLGGLFAGLLYLAFGLIKPQGLFGHLVRFVLLFVCWILLLNFTAVTSNSSFSPSLGNTNITFGNSVLSFIWEILTAIVGILIIYEIFKMLGSIGSSTVGNLGGNLSKAGGWVNNTRGGWDNLKNSLKKGNNEIKEEQGLTAPLTGLEKLESNQFDFAAQNSKKLTENLKKLQEQLGLFSQKVSDFQANPGKYNQNSFREANQKIMKNVSNALNKCNSIEVTRQKESLSAYQAATKEFNAENAESSLAALTDASDEILAITRDPANQKYNILPGDVNNFIQSYNNAKPEIRKIMGFTKQKLEYIWQLQDEIQKEGKKLINIENEIKARNWKENPATPEILTTLSKQIQDVINAIAESEGKLEVAYTINRNQVPDIQKLRDYLENMSKSYSNITGALGKKRDIGVKF